MNIEETLNKLLENFNRLEAEVQELSARVAALESGDKKPSQSIKTGLDGEHVRSPSDVVMEAKLGETSSSAEGRIKCPKCGSLQYHVQEDKDHPVSYMSGKAIYTKKYVCKKCGNTWT